MGRRERMGLLEVSYLLAAAQTIFVNPALQSAGTLRIYLSGLVWPLVGAGALVRWVRTRDPVLLDVNRRLIVASWVAMTAIFIQGIVGGWHVYGTPTFVRLLYAPLGIFVAIAVYRRIGVVLDATIALLGVKCLLLDLAVARGPIDVLHAVNPPGLGARNDFAGLMMLILVLRISLWVYTGRRPPAVVVVAMVPIGAALLLTFVRSGAIALVAGVLAIALASLRRQGRLSGRAILATVAGFLLISPILAMPTVRQRLTSLTLQDSSGRNVFWQQAWRGFLRRPAQGHGFGSFDFASRFIQQDFSTAAKNVTANPLDAHHTSSAHNLFLQIMYEGGLVGLVVVAWSVWHVLKRCWHPVLMPVAVAFAVEGIFETFPYVVQASWVLGLVFAVGLAARHREIEQPRREHTAAAEDDRRAGAAVPSDMTVQSAFGVLSRRRWLIALVVAACAMVGVAWGSLATPVYSARAQLVIQPPSVSPLTTGALATGPLASKSTPPPRIDPLRDVQTEIEIITSGAIRQMVATDVKAADPPPVSATPLVDADAIALTVRSSDPMQAARIANAYSQAYLRYRTAQVADAVAQARQLLENRIAELQRQIEVADSPGGSAARDALIGEQRRLKEQLDRAQLLAGLPPSGTFVATPAAVPTAPSSAGPLLRGVFGGAFGLFLGAGLALLVDSLDRSVRSSEDIAQTAPLLDSRLATLVVIPFVGRRRSRSESGSRSGPEPEAALASIRTPRSAVAEAYRDLRTTLEFLALERPLRTVLVTSPAGGDGKTTTAVNLGVVLSNEGHRVCLVSANLRRPRLEAVLDVSGDGGFSDVLTGRSPVSVAVKPVPAIDNLYVLPAGPPPLDPAALLASRRAHDVLESIAAAFDLVIVDAPPVLPVADAGALARGVDGVILVVRAGHTTRGALVRATQLLAQAGVPLLGVVVNAASRGRGRRSDSYDGYDGDDGDDGYRHGSHDRRSRARRDHAGQEVLR